MTDDYVVFRFYPKYMMDMDSMQIRLFELDTGMHIIREGWFKSMPKTEDNMVTWEVCHETKDLYAKHMLSPDELNIETDIINQALLNL